MDEVQKKLILEEYGSNDMAKLRKISYPMFIKFGGISEQDYDNFYSKANEELWKATETFDDTKGVPFESYLKGCLDRKFKTEITMLNRLKRKTDRLSISIDTPIGEEDGLTIGDFIASDFNIENELSEENGFSKENRVERYLDALSPSQKKIAMLIINGYTSVEIKRKLNISDKQYLDMLNDMKTFEKARILKHTDYVQIEEEKSLNYENTQTLEKSKPDRLSIASIVKKINNYTIRFDHPLQRESEQWSPAMKGNLISDILQGNPIPALVFAEQIVNGLAIIWDLDGKQRCTNVYSYKNDGYKITKNIRRWNISYQATLKENNKPILDQNGFPQSEKREFDIRGKKFTDLPEELQDRFNDYNFEIVQYLNCSSEDIAYHIARYNEGKPMSASQKGLTRLGEEFASMVKSISSMPFFKEQGGYKVSESNNGIVNRVVVESVMTSNFLGEWKKKQEDMCEFMKENATVEMFDRFEDMVDRISSVGTEEVFGMFDSKDSFIWFGLFARFVDTGLDDNKFIEFMAEFSQSLHNKKVNGISFDDLNGKSTKDKNVVIGKIEYLEYLMNEFLHIDIEETQLENVDIEVLEDCNDTLSILDFVRENVDSDITEYDIQDYEGDLEVLSLDVDNGSKLLEDENHISLVAIIAYSYIKDLILDKWFVNYFAKNKMYLKDQKKNFLHMKDSLETYLKESEDAA